MLVSRTITLGTPQLGGRVPVVEVHTDDSGVSYTFHYLSEPSDDVNAIAQARALTLLEQLKAQEIELVLRELLVPNLHHATKDELLVVWRDLFRKTEKERAGALATWVLNHLEGGHWTDEQLRRVFSVSTNDYSSLKSRLESMRLAWNNTQVLRGE